MSKTIHILGAGSLGLLWAARLTQAGIPCKLILRNGQALQYWQKTDRLTLEKQDLTASFKVTAEQATSSDEPIRTLIVATKAWAVKDALDSLDARLKADTRFLLLQNGLGSQQFVSARFPDQQVLCASVTDGAWKRSANHVVWAGAGQTLIGNLTKQPAPRWLNRLDIAGINWCWEPQMLDVLWQKLAINCVINPVTALYDCLNGDVAKHLGTSMAPLIGELHALLTNQGIDVSQTALTTRIEEVIRNTANNSSSMRQDIHAGRRTEIDFILGYACRAARQAGLSTPHLEQLYHQLQRRLSELNLPTH